MPLQLQRKLGPLLYTIRRGEICISYNEFFHFSHKPSTQLPLQTADKIACNVLSNQAGRQADCSSHADLVLQMLRIRNYFNPPLLCHRNKQFALYLLVIHRCYEGRNYVLQVESKKKLQRFHLIKMSKSMFDDIHSLEFQMQPYNFHFRKNTTGMLALH